MPILGSFGAGSARGFGQTAGAGEPAYVNATGGTIVEEGNYRIHVFTGPGTFEVSKLSDGVPSSDPTNKADYMIVAGGGASGSFYGGGGGAGGFRETPGTATGSYTASPIAGSVCATTLSVTSYPVTVGSGGAAPSPDPVGGNCSTPGGDSTIFSATSAGGGRGGGRTGRSAGSGGSGGGGTQGSASGGGGNSPPTTPSQGKSGGSYGNSPGSVTPPSQQNEIGGGGGGGATDSGEQGGNGGTGAGTQITTCNSYGDDATPGSTRVFAGGGAGIRAYCEGPGGGGRRGTYPGQTGAGQANTGGGGGGCAATGGSGIVMIRYRIL